MSRAYELDKPALGVYDPASHYLVPDKNAVAGRLDFTENATLGI
jgi:hypothetical protein